MATLATIRQAVRDQINEAYGGFFTDTKLNRLINRCYLSVAEEVSKRGDFHQSRVDITTVSGTYLYAVTSIILNTDKIGVLNSEGYLLQRIHLRDESMTETGASATAWALVGNSVALYPVPTVSGEVYTVVCDTLPATLTGDASTLSLPGGQAAEEYLIAMVVLKCRHVEGDADMISVAKADLKDARNALMSTIVRTGWVEQELFDR